MKKAWNNRQFVIVMALVISFLVASPTLAKWSDESVLPSLSSLNIFELTRNLVNETDGMIKDTDQLQKEVAKASKTLDALNQQNQLLTSQVQTNQGIQQELNKQLDGNVKARELMEQILVREEKTLQFSKQVADQSNKITGQMDDTVQSLSKVANETGSVGSNTQKLKHQVDLLLVQLDQSVNNFRFIARITDALRYLKPKINLPLPIPDLIPSKPTDLIPIPLPPLPPIKNPIDDILDRILPKEIQLQKGKGLEILLP